MSSKETIEKLIELLSEDAEVSEFYKEHFQWADTRKQCWESGRIRIGVIGVTSSGKSTLINALLGCDILSSAVVPSSSQLVTCSYGKDYAAQIYFENGVKKELKGERFKTKFLSEYSDERSNPQNIKRVKNIEIQSSDFSLPQEVVLIDSPGLDAYGLEMHEKLTLETLIPTVDVCLFVTTMKTNSDGKAREILNVVSKYGCPLIIVQNMLDSVCASPSGDKTAVQVAREHYERVSKMVSESSVADKSKVRIVQMSARFAGGWRIKSLRDGDSKYTKERFEESGYDLLLKAINELLAEKKPEIEAQRLVSIDKTIKTLSSDIDLRLDNVPIQSIGTEFNYSDMKQQLDKVITDIGVNFDKIKADYSNNKASLELKIKKASSDAKIKEIVEEVNTFVHSKGEDIYTIVTDGNDFLRGLASKLSIPIRDFAETPSLASYTDLTIEKKMKIIKIKVPERGGWGRVKRKLGEMFGKDKWGWKEAEETRTVTDIETTKRKLLDRLSEAMNSYENGYSDWKKGSFQNAYKQISAQIETGKKASEKREKENIENEKLRKLQTNLKKLQNGYQSQVSALERLCGDKVKDDFKCNQKIKEIEVSKIAEELYGIAKMVVKNQHQRIIRKFIEDEDLINYMPVFIGWDQRSIDDFCYYSGIEAPKVFNLLKKNSETSYEGHRCFFILVNTIQAGNAEKQISELKLERFLTRQDHIVWVIQDFVEILGSGQVREALNFMQTIGNKYLPDISGKKLLIHPNPIYNIAYLKYQQKKPITQGEEIEFLDDIKQNYGEWCSPADEASIGMMIRNNSVKDDL